MRVFAVPRSIIFYLLMSIALTACMAINTVDASPSTIAPDASTPESTCPLTESVWAKPPQDSAVQDPPAYGYYYVNEDRSIWASAWWTEKKYENYLRAGEEGVKAGWFRPAGVELVITGQRLDAQAPPLDAHIPCCYPTRFQATGLMFPIQGCWEVMAEAGDKVLSFIVNVKP